MVKYLAREYGEILKLIDQGLTRSWSLVTTMPRPFPPLLRSWSLVTTLPRPFPPLLYLQWWLRVFLVSCPWWKIGSFLQNIYLQKHCLQIQKRPWKGIWSWNESCAATGGAVEDDQRGRGTPANDIAGRRGLETAEAWAGEPASNSAAPSGTWLLETSEETLM